MFTNRTSLIIPTKNRSEKIIKLINQITSLNLNFNEILVLNKNSGKPYIKLIGQTKKTLDKKFKKKKTKISVSLSDEKKYAVAFVTISQWKIKN